MGAVKDTYNLLADGIIKLLRALAAVAKIAVGEWAEAQGYEQYLGSSIKGEAGIDWSDRKARTALLAELVADADRLLELARQAWVELPDDSAQRQSIVGRGRSCWDSCCSRTSSARAAMAMAMLMMG